MMMKNLIKTLGFILPVVGLSVAIATNSVPRNSNKIINKVCIESDKIQGGQKCATAEVMINNNSYACLSITSSGNVVELNSNGNGSMKFTCEATTAGAHTFKFYCGNGNTSDLITTTNGSASYTCNYSSDDEGPKQVSCVVDNDEPTNPNCNKTIQVGISVPLNYCGDGKKGTGEECDLGQPVDELIKIKNGYLDNYGYYSSEFNGEGYSCKYCKIINGSGYVYEPAECLAVDSPISVMNNELVPYWRRLLIDDAIVNDGNSCDKYSGEKTLLNKDTMKCIFNVYNGTHKENGDPIRTFREDCYNDNIDKKKIYEYFQSTHNTQYNIAGAAVNSTFALTNGNSLDEFGEYKLVLEKVEYDYCNTQTHTWEKGNRYGAVCQVDFAVTRPYAMQISTFNASPIGVTEEGGFLKNFYDIYGNSLLNSRTDLANIMDISDTEYSNENNVQDEINAFKEKYGKLAVTVNTIRGKNGFTQNLSAVFGSNVTIKKVPNQHIYFIEGNNKLYLSQDKIKQIGSAYTIFVDGMDVEIEGDVLQYAMIITTKHMSFKDGGSNDGKSRCASGGQVVQGLYVAGEGFEAANDEPDSLRNTSVTQLWCPWGGLHVKGVLIGDGIDNIVSSKRSQLNSWFNTTSSQENTIRRERRQKIIAGASVLIEYSPSLWKTLPPGAEVFTESLEVYRK